MSPSEIWQKPHAEFGAPTANNAGATECLKSAVSRLNKFSSPKLNKAAPKAGLSADHRSCVNKGGEITTAARAGIAGTRIALVQLLQADAVSEPLISIPDKNHEGYKVVVSVPHIS